MPNRLLATTAASITELKRDPMGTVTAGSGNAVVILNRNEPAFYCVPAATYEAMLDQLEDAQLNALADQRLTDGQASVPVSLDDL